MTEKVRLLPLPPPSSFFSLACAPFLSPSDTEPRKEERPTLNRSGDVQSAATEGGSEKEEEEEEREKNVGGGRRRSPPFPPPQNECIILPPPLCSR